MEVQDFNQVRQCRHGRLLYNVNDTYIGRSLALYGEYSEGEAALFQQIVRPGMHVWEIGANIGTHTVPLARLVGSSGRVVAFEPQRLVFQMLCGNIALNSLTNVYCRQEAVGAVAGEITVPVLDGSRRQNFGGVGLGEFDTGETVPMVVLDKLEIPALHFLKIDVEGMEQQVLAGAQQTIARLQPVIYVENDRRERSPALIRLLDSLGYRMYWHAPPLFNPHNYLGNAVNEFGEICSVNMLCCPTSLPQQLSGFEPVEIPEAA